LRLIAVRLVPPDIPLEGMEARSGGPSLAVSQVGWLVSMDGYSGVGTNYSSFVPSHRDAKTL
jgi:hypothetical protein